MNAQIIGIGTELLLGFTINDDSALVARALAELGINCHRHLTVGDNPERLARTLEEALSQSDLVVTCGGLGPTVDDITLETIAQATHRSLRLHRPTLTQIQRRFRRRGIRMPKNNVRQAYLPQGAIPFPNQVGTAPGFFLKISTSPTKLLIALPGPPYELTPMLKKDLPKHLKPYAGGEIIRSKTLNTPGQTESNIDAKVADLLKLKGKVTLGIYASPALVKLRITAKVASTKEAEAAILRLERKIRKRLGNLIFGADEETLESAVGALLKKKRLTLAVAESCTGGLVGHRITEVAGATDYFRGGMIAYSNDMKCSALGIPEKTLKRHGAVSAQTARAMADGVRDLTGAALGLGLTGIAGPTGGSAKKPAGTVCIALSTPKGTRVHQFQFPGTRQMVKFRSSQAALNLVRLYCLK